MPCANIGTAKDVPTGRRHQLVQCGTNRPSRVQSPDDNWRSVTTKEVLRARCSGYGADEDIRRGQEAGFSDHVVKPVSLEDLKRAIARVRGVAPSWGDRSRQRSEVKPQRAESSLSSLRDESFTPLSLSRQQGSPHSGQRSVGHGGDEKKTPPVSGVFRRGENAPLRGSATVTLHHRRRGGQHCNWLISVTVLTELRSPWFRPSWWLVAPVLCTLTAMDDDDLHLWLQQEFKRLQLMWYCNGRGSPGYPERSTATYRHHDGPSAETAWCPEV